eukprot:3322637-Rhodomonas_salina.1
MACACGARRSRVRGLVAAERVSDAVTHTPTVLRAVGTDIAYAAADALSGTDVECAARGKKRRGSVTSGGKEDSQRYAIDARYWAVRYGPMRCPVLIWRIVLCDVWY